MTATRVIDDHIELANIGTKTHTEIESHIQGIGNYAFPAADGNADQLLKTSGAGVLSWIDQPAGFACGSLNACNLTDIGTRAHSSLTGIGTSDHHVKYTDAEAVAAADASNIFLEKGRINIVTNMTTMRQNGITPFFKYHWATDDVFIVSDVSVLLAENIATTYINMGAAINFPVVMLKGNDTEKTLGRIVFIKNVGETKSYIDFQACYSFGMAFSAFQVHTDKIDVRNHPIKDIKNHAYSALSGTKRLIEVLIGSTPHYIEASPIKA